MWAAVACLFGVPAANAEYVIIRVKLNSGVFSAPPAGGFQGNGGGFGGVPGMPGIPGGGQFGNVGGPGPGIPGGPPGGGGRPGGRPGGMSYTVPFSGPGGGSRPTPPGGGSGPPGGFQGAGGAAGFVGVGAVGPGMPGFPQQQNTAPHILGADDYVTAVVAVKNLKPIPTGASWANGPGGKREVIGVAGNLHFQTKWGTTWADSSLADITMDYRGYNGGFDKYPDPVKQLEHKRREGAKQYGSPEGQVSLAEWCLETGLPDEAIKIIDKLNEHPAKDTFKPSTTLALETFNKIKPILEANVEKTAHAVTWKDRLVYAAISVSKHYAIVHEENTQESAIVAWNTWRTISRPCTYGLPSGARLSRGRLKRWSRSSSAMRPNSASIAIRSKRPTWWPMVSMPGARTWRCSAAAGSTRQA